MPCHFGPHIFDRTVPLCPLPLRTYFTPQLLLLCYSCKVYLFFLPFFHSNFFNAFSNVRQFEGNDFFSQHTRGMNTSRKDVDKIYLMYISRCNNGFNRTQSSTAGNLVSGLDTYSLLSIYKDVQNLIRKNSIVKVLPLNIP